MKARLSSSDVPRRWRGSRRANARRPVDRAARRLGDGRRRADLLPGADRQRGLPAHRDRAALGAGAGAADRLRAAAGRRGDRLPRLHARREHARRRSRSRPARARRACPARASCRRPSRPSEPLVARREWNAIKPRLRAAADARDASSRERTRRRAPRSTSRASATTQAQRRCCCRRREAARAAGPPRSSPTAPRTARW